MDEIIKFGKYKGKTFEEIYNTDPRYCQWLLNQNILINDNDRQELTEALGGKDLTETMRWGKYKNAQTIEWIYSNDRKYFDWLTKNEYINQNCPSLAKKIDDLIAKHG